MKTKTKKPRKPTWEILAPLVEKALEMGYVVTGTFQYGRFWGPNGEVCLYGALAIATGHIFGTFSPTLRDDVCAALNIDVDAMRPVEYGFEWPGSVSPPSTNLRRLGARIRHHFDVL